MINKNLYLHNNTFHNVDRYFQFADCENRFFCQDFTSHLIDYTCTRNDSETGETKPCSNKDAVFKVGRDVGDGERNTAFIDFDGIFTKDGKPGYIMAPEVRFLKVQRESGALFCNREHDKNHFKQTTLMTGCYSQEEVPNHKDTMKDGPYGRVCPITLDTGFLAVNHAEEKWLIPNGSDWEGNTIKYNSGKGFHYHFSICLWTREI